MKSLANINEDRKIEKLISDIANLFEIAPNSYDARIKALNNIIQILNACKNPIENRYILNTVIAKLKKNAMTKCRGYVGLQTVCLKTMSAINEINKIYNHADASKWKAIEKIINEHCDSLIEKRALLTQRKEEPYYTNQSLNRNTFFHSDNKIDSVQQDFEKGNSMPNKA